MTGTRVVGVGTAKARVLGLFGAAALTGAAVFGPGLTGAAQAAGDSAVAQARLCGVESLLLSGRVQMNVWIMGKVAVGDATTCAKVVSLAAGLDQTQLAKLTVVGHTTLGGELSSWTYTVLDTLNQRECTENATFDGQTACDVIDHFVSATPTVDELRVSVMDVRAMPSAVAT